MGSKCPWKFEHWRGWKHLKYLFWRCECIWRRVRCNLLNCSTAFWCYFYRTLQISIIGVFRTQPLYNAGITKLLWVRVPIAKVSPIRVIRFATHVVGFWLISALTSSQWSSNFIVEVWIRPSRWPRSRQRAALFKHILGVRLTSWKIGETERVILFYYFSLLSLC